jgi:plasmid stabilization system protein ParE
MAEFRLSTDAEAELDDIWLRIARESGSIEIATRVVEDITERFWLLAQCPYIGRRRGGDLSSGLRSFAVGDYVIIHRIERDDVVLILHMFHGNRDIATLLSY